MKKRRISKLTGFQLRLEQLESREMLTANAFEQHAVYLINVERNERDLAPIVINGRLMESAGEKADDLVDCFQHICNGKGPSDLASDAGYDALVSEVLANHFPAGDVEDQAGRAVELWMSNTAHRAILLGESAEIGIGRSRVGNTVYWAAHLGTSDPNDVFVTGVVFNDSNENERYDYGEGLAGVKVANDDSSATTNAGGGWKVRVNTNQSQNLTVSGGPFDGETTAEVNVRSQTRSVDFIEGSDRIYVDFVSRAAAGTTSTRPPAGGDDGDTSSGDSDGDSSNEGNSGKSLSPTGRVSGRVFVDLNEDGKKSPTEERLSNWVVYLDTNRNGTRDAFEPQKLTDRNGRYEFELLPGESAGFGHRVSVELKSNFDNTTKLVRSVLVEAGLHKTNKDFGVVRDNGVSGFVFQDTNRDGNKNRTERKLEGWTVFVDSNANGRKDAGERSTQTNANGRYVIKSLQPGVHRIVVLPRAGFDFTVDGKRSVPVQAGHIANARNFGVNAPRVSARPPRAPTQSRATISGRVFEDSNGDGQRTSNERLLANWRVYVDANRNGRRDPSEMSTLTDDEGRYEFTLPRRTYRIGVESRGTFEFTTNQIRSVDISDGQSKTRRDFGVRRAASVSGVMPGR